MPINHKMHDKRITIGVLREAFCLFFRFNNYLSRYCKFQILLIVSAIVSILFSVFTPYLGKLALDEGILSKNLGLFLKYTLVGASVYILRQITDRATFLIKNYTTRKIKIDLSKNMFKKVQKLSLQSFTDSSAGGNVARLNADITASANIIATTLPDLTKAILQLVLITAIILFINAKLLFFILCYQLIIVIQIQFFTAKQDNLAKALYRKSWEMSKILTQLFSQIYLVKASGKMAAMIRKYFHAFFDSMRIEAKTSRFTFFSDTLVEFSNKLFFGAVGFIGTLLVIKGKLTLGSFGAIMAYISQGTVVYTLLANMLQRIILNRLPLERIAEILDEEIAIKEKPDAQSLNFTKSGIEFKDVSFGYTPDRRILDKISFVVPPGSKVALVGSSGRGKTTIANLILRLYDANDGKILIDSCDLKNIKFKSLYTQVSLAPQAAYNWSGTIKEAISFYSRNIDESALVYAAQLADAHYFIEKFPDGYNTTLGDMVSKISQGERQRIAIASALLKQPKILILDEACSSLDSKTEEKIIDNISNAYPDLTLILISHRLSSVKKMEKVYFLKGPDDVLIGSHDELAAKDVKYNELFASQLSSLK